MDQEVLQMRVLPGTQEPPGAIKVKTRTGLCMHQGGIPRPSCGRTAGPSHQPPGLERGGPGEEPKDPFARTQKMVNYVLAGRSQRKLWWRPAAVLTCTSAIKLGYRGGWPVLLSKGNQVNIPEPGQRDSDANVPGYASRGSQKSSLFFVRGRPPWNRFAWR